MAKKCCSNCGCERNITLTSNVNFQNSGFGIGYKRLCVPCLLRAIGLSKDKGQYDYDKAMEVVA